VKKWVFIVVSLLSVFSFIGCSALSASGGTAGRGQASQGDDETVPLVKKRGAGVVIAEGVVEPARSSYLSLEIPGDMVDVLVKNGDRVEAGMPLVRLDTREMELVLRSAEQDVIAQEAALQQLLNGASEKVVARADKNNADQIAQAEVALQVKQLQLERARVEDPAANVATARARVEQAQLNLAQMQAEPIEADIAAAQSGVDGGQAQLEQLLADPDEQVVEIARLKGELAKNALWQAQLERDAIAGRVGVPAYQKDLANATVGSAEISAAITQLEYALAAKGATDEAIRIAQAAVRQAQAQKDRALSAKKAHAVGLEILKAQIDEAEAQLAQAITAQETYTITLEVLAAEVEAAQLGLEALKTWDNPYRDDASDEEVAQARAVLEKAKIAVEQLKVQLEDAELTAPFAGSVVDVQVEVGEQVNPGQVVVVLATLDELEIHTTDLTELDVADVAVGQPVTVTVDAWPDREFTGTIKEIALQGKDYRGDVVYEVTATLDRAEGTDILRWGMTAMVEIMA
jgi:HlyD family secretion protein